MKRILGLKSICTVLSLSMLTSCAWLEQRQALFDKHDEKMNQTAQMVPKTQYDQLLGKYETLLNQVKDAEMEKKKSVESPFNGKDPSNLVNELSKVQPPSELVETVDAFSVKAKASSDVNESLLANQPMMSENAIENQILRLKKAINLVNSNRFDQALGLLKDLEKSPVIQIKVRAKYYLAEMLFMQKEYDLSMQLFEEIIGSHAYSGVVIKSLGRLIVCCEKLKLSKKRDRYYSILHDFFEA
ncbi:tetratricopeptide repeat protein [Halobacteriovorax sp. GB3]|uniref:tetratricopeptide repeat protein n=1 Tax=Halobacteriovorax sp. GB3 TaxID=2719615 RepID=UPI002362E2F4|nr:tetratricopeptide repeat protein [Halobacteriovorax sp. GB3]MDD0853753.1 tetratricopeptide repeat protein [Halobacteriovorax sp. GB3]